MGNLHSIKVDESDITERFALISNMISENFQVPWTAQPVGMEHRPASLCWAQAEGVRFCHAEMSPLRLTNLDAKPACSDLYYIYTADQHSCVRLASGAVVNLHACDFLIHDADMPLEWLVPNAYTTRSLLIDKALFHEYVPRDSTLIGRRLCFAYGVEKILSDMMDAAWAVTRAGHFEESGQKMVRAFLDVLSMFPQRQEGTAAPSSQSALQLRRLQVKAFIDKHYAMPGLGVAAIAEHLHLSPRYLQMAFASDDITPSDYLRNRRLAACASLLCDHAKRSVSITEIALSCGFNSSAYFSTEFRRVYGMSPRAYRAAHGVSS
jgi:AraC-like DNA-binding protein